MTYTNVSVSGLVAAILMHGCMTSMGTPQATRMSDTTYVVRYLNGTSLCDVKKSPACINIMENAPRAP